LLKLNEFRGCLTSFLYVRIDRHLCTTNMSLEQFYMMEISHLDPARNHECCNEFLFSFILLFSRDDVCASLPKRTLITTTLDQQGRLVGWLSLE
jgi:hypothetical protein